MIKNISRYFVLLAVVLLALPACEKDDDSEGVGNPSVSYVRLISDSVAVTSANPGSDIAIIGSDLQELESIAFNGIEATLKKAFITSSSVITSIPEEYPAGDAISDTMTMVFSNGEVVYYPFEVIISGPEITSVSSKYDIDGNIAVIQGTGFLLSSDNDAPVVTFSGNLEGEMLEYSNTELQVRIPDGVESGDVTVTTEYGTDSEYLEISETIILEAEDGEYSSDLYVSTTVDGYSGEGCLMNFESTADYVTVSIELTEAANYDVYIGYTTSGWGDKECIVSVNGDDTAYLSLGDTDDFSEAEYGTIALSSGTNTITVAASWTWFGVDYIKLVPSDKELLEGTVLEVEDGEYSSDLTVETAISGYSGDGYLYYFGEETSYTTVSYDCTEEGSYKVYVGYSTSGWGEKECNVAINDGTATSLYMSDTSSFEEAAYGSVDFSAGINTITVSANWTWFIIDYVRIVKE